MKRTSYIILSILVVFGIAGCNNNHSGHSHSHDHEDNLQLTAYNQDFELYAKATISGNSGNSLEITSNTDFKSNSGHDSPGHFPSITAF